ncbi:MAG TPA: membrane-bound PQQ-dependent dehydrogenase, glucose/quinate/shikimate family [Rhodanobacteraceae bacterium]|nr:membrane-bound PQQ-dependent dehydrogenase, glucose/quinate/shikimate family [Rhodanobacteraceae bacterium]
MLAILTGAVLLILGAALAAGGVWLAFLGGSWAYVFLGLGWLASGVLLVLRRRAALAVYAVLLLCTLGWAIWEVGLDRWALVPRYALFGLVGLWLLMPWISGALRITREPLEDRRTRRAAWRGPRSFLALAVLAALVVGLVSLIRDPFDIAGTLPRTAAAPAPAGSTAPAADWTAWGGTGLGQRWSALTQITPANASQLQRAWVFHTGDEKGPGDPVETTSEDTPLKIGDTLYLCTTHDQVVALDPATGKQRWRFDPEVKSGHQNQHLTCRGLAYWDGTKAMAGGPALPATPGSALTAYAASAPAPATSAALAGAAGSALPASPASTAMAAMAPMPADAPCATRIFVATIDARLFALDAATGTPCTGFADHGVIHLDRGMPNLKPGYYMQTSPPVATQRLLVVGGSINDNESVHNPSGVIRAYDIRSGRLVWNFDPGNPTQTAPLPAGQHYTAGAPNQWAPASVDEKLGLVYVPLGNQSPDQVGIHRSPQVDKYSSSIVALDLDTGQPRWRFQAVHHDLWDRDMPAQPSLLDLTIHGTTVPALVAPTKQGEVYVLDRRTGKPLLPVHEVPAPASSIPGEHASRSQPMSALSFMPPPLTGKDMWGATPFDQLACRIQFESMGYSGPWTPPATHRTLTYPGNFGVFNWGGVAVDPQRQIMIATPMRLAYTFRLVPRHKPHTNLVSKGSQEHWNENYGGDYAIVIKPFLSPFGLPCQQPPWGAMAGVDLRTGKLAWRHRIGTTRDRMPDWLPVPFQTGMPGIGGVLVTPGGVAFYSGTTDNYMRAFDVATGEQLWQDRLPYGGQATPMTYSVNGRQYVLVTDGGHGSVGTDTGDAVIAWALPASAASSAAP